jgi:hypothetical protein
MTQYQAGIVSTTATVGYLNFSGVLVNQAVVRTNQHGTIINQPVVVLTAGGSALVHVQAYTSVHV